MAKQRIALLGMAPSGEACLVRYPDGRVWVSSIHTPPQQIEATDADQYIAAHDWTRIDRSFATWDALDTYRNRHATSPAEAIPRIADYDANEIRDVLDETSTADDPEQRASARVLLIDILRHTPVVRTDDDLYAAVLTRLEELTAPRRRLPTRAPHELAAAMDRFAA